MRVLRQPNHKLQPMEIDALLADYAAGLCLTALGEKYGLHRQTAKAHLERRCGRDPVGAAGAERRTDRPGRAVVQLRVGAQADRPAARCRGQHGQASAAGSWGLACGLVDTPVVRSRHGDPQMAHIVAF